MNTPLIAKEILFPASVSTAQGYVNVSRATDPGQIAKFLSVQGLPFAIGGMPVPFCAAGSYYSDGKTYCRLAKIPYTEDSLPSIIKALIPFFEQHYYKPSASVSTMVADAQRRGIWIDAGDIGDTLVVKPGWKACFTFPTSDGSVDHHIEIVKEDGGDNWTDIGFNTCSGGHCGIVAVKSRNYQYLWGFIATY